MKNVFHWIARRVDLFSTWMAKCEIEHKIKREYRASLRELNKTKNFSTRQGRRKYERERDDILKKQNARLIALEQTYEKLKRDTLGEEV